MNIYYNPLEQRCKSVTGGVRQNEKLKIKVFCDKNDEPCVFVLQKDECEAQYLHMHAVSDGWEITLDFNETGLYFYHFIIAGKKAGKNNLRDLIILDNGEIDPYQILVYEKNFETPDWFKGGIMYQIFPDRFNKSGNISIEKGKFLHDKWNESPEFRMNEEGKVLNNDFFGGNFKGITEKLPHLKSLKVTILYLNPIFQAYSNHRYDTGDYLRIDPLLGTEQDFHNFVKECEKYGIKVILDGVFNHTGDDSRYFNKYGKYDELGAYQSKDSKYYAWYNFRNFPEKYDAWWGIDVLPAVNECEPSYIEFITGKEGVLKYWLKYNIAGYRLDVADELPDEFIVKIREAVKSSNNDAIIIGEVWEDASNKIAYSKRRKYFNGHELDSVMNYPLKDAIINFLISNQTDMLRQTIFMLLDNYPKTILDCLMNILGTHDTVRILTALGGVPAYTKEEMSLAKLSLEQKEIAKEKLKTAAILQYTLFGVPCIYYGDEIGMEGYSDPFCRYPFQWDNIDEDLLHFYQKLSAIRTKLPVFKDGLYKELFADKNCIVFERRKNDAIAVVCINRGNNKFDLKFDGKLYELLNNQCFINKFTLNIFSCAILSNYAIT